MSKKSDRQDDSENHPFNRDFSQSLGVNNSEVFEREFCFNRNNDSTIVIPVTCQLNHSKKCYDFLSTGVNISLFKL